MMWSLFFQKKISTRGKARPTAFVMQKLLLGCLFQSLQIFLHLGPIIFWGFGFVDVVIWKRSRLWYHQQVKNIFSYKLRTLSSSQNIEKVHYAISFAIHVFGILILFITGISFATFRQSFVVNPWIIGAQFL